MDDGLLESFDVLTLIAELEDQFWCGDSGRGDRTGEF